MRLVQVAKILGMTGQELRHELEQVNFGVKPTDREIPDGLAKGIIRFIANKKGLSIDVESLGMEDDDKDGEGKDDARLPPACRTGRDGQGQRTTDDGQVGPEAQAETQEGAAPQRAPGEMHVLRKLTLEDVPTAAIRKQEEALRQQKEGAPPVTKEEKEERLREQKIFAASHLAKRPDTAASHQVQIKAKEGTVLLPDAISVKELAEKTGIQVPRIIQTLMKSGIMATITQSIDFDTAAIVAAELGVQVQREQRAASAEQLLSRNLKELINDEPESLGPRPPVVVVMGHVDHGKTALLDAIRQTNVVASEAGGITQHIGAYQVEHPTSDGPRRITFLDTPGHEAFTAMRARGAQVTDIVILVVSAEEGVKATTVEAIDHAKEAGVPIIVALSKIDKERSDPDRVKGELAAQGLQPEEWGGTTPVVPCSAVTKQGIPELLDHILLMTDLQELKANPNRSAVATVIESNLDSSLGPVATVIVNTGTLRVGDICVCGGSTGRVKALIDSHGQRITSMGPSGPARMAGLDTMPTVGDILQVVSSEREARALLEQLQSVAHHNQKRTFADLVSRLTEGKVQQLRVVLKTDAQGSREAIQQALSKLEGGGAGVSVKVIHGATGAVTESDVMMASASDGIILAFHAPVPLEVQRTAEREGVQVRQYAILYELLDEVDRLLKGLVEPEEQEMILGHLEVRGVFLTKRSEQIIGGKVTDGTIKRVSFRLQRAGASVGTGRITSLKHVDKDIKEAKEGSECGMRVESSVPVEMADVLEAYVRELKRKENV
ncbi:MAG: translation initiation factor IF-2 [Candidatus Peregrinibacteria bacterium Greene0416_19]|nr:MAG: translation initiation factor IF-2 [Candidatus Peregrinibacteria bacterium Greene0416_19]